MGAVHSDTSHRQYTANKKTFDAYHSSIAQNKYQNILHPFNQQIQRSYFSNILISQSDSNQHIEQKQIDGYLWDGGFVPYSISSGVENKCRKMIIDAIMHFNTEITSVRFIRKSGRDENYIEFIQQNDENPYSQVGCQKNGRQTINVCFPTFPNSTDEIQRVVVLHEMMHAIGFWHEHQRRQDRDKHVKIDGDEDINTRKAGISFEEEKYDIKSIMHYEHGAGNVYVLDETERKHAGQGTDFSKCDIYAINKLYEIEAMKELTPYLKSHFGAIKGEGLMGNFIFRTICMACCLLTISLFGFTIYFQDLTQFGEFGDKLAIGYGLSGFAAVLIFVTSLITIIVARFGMNVEEKSDKLLILWKNKKIKKLEYIKYGIILGYVVGGLFQFMGGCGIAFAWNHSAKDINFSPFASSIAGIFFIEQTYIGSHAIIAGLDFGIIVEIPGKYKPLMNDHHLRSIVYMLLYFFLALVDFFAFAVLSGKIEAKNRSNMDNAGAALNTVFYFVLIFLMIYYCFMATFPSEVNAYFDDKIKVRKIIMSVVSALFLLSIIMILIGYFVFTANWINFFEGTYFGAPYFVGVGLFVFAMGILISLDIGFDSFCIR